MSKANQDGQSDDGVEILRVLKGQAQRLQALEAQVDRLSQTSAAAIDHSQNVLARYQQPAPVPVAAITSHDSVGISRELRAWDALVADAQAHGQGPALFADILTQDEIAAIEKRIDLLGDDFRTLHQLDKVDLAICGIAGSLAAVVDIFCVQMPQHPGFLGGQAVAGGPLANWLRTAINRVFSPEEIKKLERAHWVPYDPATSLGLSQRIAGLGPRTHRFQSLGHDPILGFVFGVKDILAGTFTSIDKHGKLIIQSVDNQDPTLLTMNLFAAIGRCFGHMQSDLATATGLPAPLMPLMQFLQFGDIGQQGYTVGEIARVMYRSNYDFRHFLAMSVPVLLIEILVRLCYFAKRRQEGHEISQAIPFAWPGAPRKPKLQTMLFCAHLVATAANVGKLAITQNPLTINYPQWLAFFRYALPQLKWILLDKENAHFAFIEQALQQDWLALDTVLEATWQAISAYVEPIN
ncbi:MAG: hypothetical protein R3C14_51985 [Caldilineaceae bacterium]